MQSKKSIDSSLDPSNKNFSNDNLIREILSSIEITEVDFYWALSIFLEADYKMHVKRSSGSRFASCYNPVLFKVWEANLDIQPEHNYYKVLTCMTAHF